MKFIINNRDLHIANIFSILAFIIAFWGNYLIITINIYVGFIIILIACFFDILDGYFARKFNSKSSLGNILDSFSDIIIYLFPLLLIYLNLYSFNFLFLVSSSILIFSGLFRLSYFTANGTQIIDNKKYYIGMPVYFLFILVTVLFFNINIFLINLLFIIFSILMILDIKIRKVNLFVSVLYLTSLTIFSYLFLIGIL